MNLTALLIKAVSDPEFGRPRAAVGIGTLELKRSGTLALWNLSALELKRFGKEALWKGSTFKIKSLRDDELRKTGKRNLEASYMSKKSTGDRAWS